MSNIDKHTFADDESGKTYFIHPAAFGSTKNPGYGHVAVVKAEDFEKLRAKQEAAEKRIAELSRHLQCAHGFIEHTEAFGHAASNGILCCGDAQWNIDASKSVLAAAGKGEAS
ncbi:hypothetical protein B1H42_06085 [Enterobacter cloacae subsp. cloacae]|uniref:hypothetical protein n=1 Tax=Enterobacter cloacae TaxID=550 RepID=UPI0009F505DC|nr:hypothetical protein [Enterobacter cloacae]ORC23931.1 hypothetical protein B1H42_06085 [Enterobacter cloacae subsp. cloacae]ORC32017.1 hypothetical protein B2M05_04725 [Enterobacter cloacae subsp. cloacae]